jgi:hypothetical protein
VIPRGVRNSMTGPVTSGSLRHAKVINDATQR